MSSVISGSPDVNNLSATSQVSRTQQSLLFPTLVKKFRTDRRLSILEIGQALPETVRFFSDFKCRVHFAAMFTDPILQTMSGEYSEAEIADQITRSFDFPEDTRFDLCLFWDFLNYLNDKTVIAFNTAIKPYLQNGTRAHAITVRTLDTSFANQQYGIEEAHLFSIRPRAAVQARTFPHTQAILVNLLSSFEIDQGMLLPDGRLELLMTARSPAE